MKNSIKNNFYNILNIVLVAVLFFSFQNITHAQNSQEFKGKIVDSYTNKALPLADLTIIDTNISTIANNEGEFSLKIPNAFLDKAVLISYLGYKKQQISLSKFKKTNTIIKLVAAATVLAQVNVNTPKNAENLVKMALSLKGDNYANNEAVMTGFYRETIKKRSKNASLSEAVLKIYKQPYISNKKDAIKLIKARKNTDYSKLDTLAIKLQGGPFSTLYTDVIKYPEYIFNDNEINDYTFSFEPSTQINNKLVFVVNFKQKENITRPMYYGQLFINAENYAITSAIYNLNVTNRTEATNLFIKKKPRKVKVYPTEAAYRVSYRIKDGKWYYAYSNILLAFKVKWDKKLFNSRYTLQSEMAITNWDENTTAFINKSKNMLRPNTILANEASGFADPDFWGEYNIIEPEKSIESAIKKISKQLKKT